jgi:ABC-type lipoprotein export system ATPase subunit
MEIFIFLELMVSATYCCTGSSMINDVQILNYKCFERLTISGCRRLNVIVGDNGSGKTSLLEAMFLALGSTSELILRFRQLRGLESQFRGSTRTVENAIIQDYFYRLEGNRTISVILTGTGPETRSVTITRGPGQTVLPLDDSTQSESTGAISFRWQDATGFTRVASPKISSAGVQFPETGEDLPDFFFFVSNMTYSSVENADRFSQMSRAKRQRQFVELFSAEYPWIEDLSIESVAGSPAIYASLRGLPDKIFLGNVSGGLNRIVTFLLAIASRPRSVILIDEIENGLYYRHHAKMCSALLSFARSYDSQLFLTTHSEEWLKALVVAAEGNFDDIALWRVERNEATQPEVYQFEGDDLSATIELGGEVRGGADEQD